MMNKLSVFGVRRLVVWFPVIPFLVYWFFSLLNYHFGLTVNPPLGWVVYLFIFSAISSFLLVFIFFTNRISAQTPLVSRSAVLIQRSGKWCLLSSIIGHFCLILDKVIAGVGIDTVITQTEFLRDQYSTTMLTTLAVPFCGLFYPSLIYTFLEFKSGVLKSKAELYLMLINPALVLVLAILSGNRASFGHFLFWLLFFIFYVNPVGVMPNYIRRVNRIAYVVVGVMGFIALAYFVFISSFRISDEYATQSANRYDLRYDISGELGRSRVENGLVLLSSYTTQQFIFVDQIIPNAEFLAFDLTPFAFWFVRQAERVGLVSGWYQGRLDAYALKVNELGLSEFGWPSLFGHALLYYGLIGTIILMACIGAILGLASVAYFQRGSGLGLLLVFLVYNFINYSYMAIPVDHYFCIGSIYCFFIWIRSK